MKKTIPVLALSTIIFLFFLNTAVAISLFSTPQGDIYTKNPTEITFCDIFKVIRNLLDIVFFELVPPVAALLLASAGVWMLFSEENPSNLEKGKNIIRSVIIGLIIIYGSWLIVNLFFQIIGVADWTGLDKGWWQINCQ